MVSWLEWLGIAADSTTQLDSEPPMTCAPTMTAQNTVDGGGYESAAWTIQASRK